LKVTRCASSSREGGPRSARNIPATFSLTLPLLAHALPARAEFATCVDCLGPRQQGEGNCAAAVRTMAEALRKVKRRLADAETAPSTGDTAGALDALVRAAGELLDTDSADLRALRLAIARALPTVGTEI